MNDDNDPFLAVMDFLDCKTDLGKKFQKQISEFMDVLVVNFFWMIFLMLSTLIFLLILSPFFLNHQNQTLINIGAFMHVGAGLAQLCHQLPYRSFQFNGIPMPVCARDIGIYLGFVFGCLTLLIKNNPKIYKRLYFPIICTLPIALDGITQTILDLRESNNFLRVLTGFIFAFGVFAFFANRIALHYYPKIREYVTHPIAIYGDFLISSLIIGLFLTITAVAVETNYVGQKQAQMIVQKNLILKEYVRTYYIGSMTSLSILEAPFYEDHAGVVSDGIRNANYSKTRKDIHYGNTPPNYVVENGTFAKLFRDMAQKEHKMGIWAVVSSNEPQIMGSASYVSSKVDSITYVDGYTGEIIETIYP